MNPFGDTPEGLFILIGMNIWSYHLGLSFSEWFLIEVLGMKKPDKP